MAIVDVSELKRAFDNAAQSGDFAPALDCLGQSWPYLIATAGSHIRELLDRTPHDVWHDDPWLVTCYAASFRSTEAIQLTAALPYFEAALALMGTSTPQLVRAIHYVHHAAALRTLGQLDDALECINRATAIVDSNDDIPLSRRIPLTTQIALHRGAIFLHAGDFDRAKADFRLACSLAEANLSVAEQIEAFGSLALIQFMLGDFELALSYVARAEAAGSSPALRDSLFSAPALVTELLIAVCQRGTDAAEHLLPRVIAAAHESDWEPVAGYAQAFAHMFWGRPHEALDLLRASLHSLDAWQPKGFVQREIAGLRAAGFLQLGDSGAAWDILATLAPTQHHTVCPARLVAHLRLITGDLRGALDALRDCENLGDAHSSRTLVDVYLLKAAVQLAFGDEEKSDVSFDRSLRLAARNRMHSPFRLVPSEAVRTMLARASERRQPLEVRSLVKRVDGFSIDILRHDSLTLSDRERSIARELVRGSSSTEIAETLFISVNTVKSHLKNVYRKLGVTSRLDAIQKARELGLQVDITPN